MLGWMDSQLSFAGWATLGAKGRRVNWYGARMLAVVLAFSASAPAQNLDELFRAVQEPRPETAARLLSERPDLARSQDARGHTALLRTAYMKRTDMANLLVSRGADINLGTTRGTRPLHAAAFAGADEIVTLLLSNGAELDALDGAQRTPLHLAAWRGHPKVVALLLARSPQLNLRDAYGQTPLHMAARAGQAEAVELLLKAGAATDVRDLNGQTAADLSRQGKHGDWERVQRLLGAPR